MYTHDRSLRINAMDILDLGVYGRSYSRMKILSMKIMDDEIKI